MLDAHWRPEGYTVPNLAVYPHQWLWDSCFHAVLWAELGRGDRAVAELEAVFAHQGSDGFVPHMTYWTTPDAGTDFWGRRWTSCITQPPMYGHAIAELTRRGIAVPGPVVDAARRGLDHLLARPRPRGLVAVFHPWETGCDDSPRWDAWSAPTWSPTRWHSVKGELVDALVFDEAEGSGPIGSQAFAPGSAAFTALVVWNLQELAEATDTSADDAEGPLVAALAARWDADRRTWPDAPGAPEPGGPPSSGVRTLEALLPLLVVGDDPACDAAWDELTAPDAFGAPFGPTQVHRDEPTYDPDRYWRGPAWPQLSYLLWVAASRAGRPELAAQLAEQLVAGARASGLAEHWHPDTGQGQGARAQSWTGLALLAAGTVPMLVP